jgi:hypothetical protein
MITDRRYGIGEEITLTSILSLEEEEEKRGILQKLHHRQENETRSSIDMVLLSYIIVSEGEKSFISHV